MSTQPADDHSEEFEQLAGLVALRVLEGEELERWQLHAGNCERCRMTVRLDREALARVSLAAPEMDPSPGFKQRLMQRAADELARSAVAVQAPPSGLADAQPDAGPSTADDPDANPSTTPEQADAPREPLTFPGPGRVVPLWRRSPWLSALAAVFVLGLFSVGAYSYENQAIATYALTGTLPGNASVILRRSGAAELDMSGVPDPGPGFIYEAWIIPAGKNPVAAGTTATGTAKLPLAGDVRGATVAITRERERVDAPTSTPLMATVVQS
jgi:hypothetical protein